MNFADARSEAVQGAHIRRKGMQPGSYVSYSFNGLRINLESHTIHASSGWTPRDDDLAADDWEICGPVEPPKPLPTWGEVFSDCQRVEGGWRTPEAPVSGFQPGAGKPKPPDQPADADSRWTKAILPEPKRDKWGRPA